MSSSPEGVPVIRKLDDTVVNRIAAGEVVQRPCSAIKEMLENSIDAGSKQVTITLAGGGLKVMRIQDDGHGIRVEDFPILCERFTTSKLKKFEDLESIQTLGFRGEALASITHVAHVTITSRTEGSPCAYKAKFEDGLLVPEKPGGEARAKPCAGNKGTLIVAEDLFYNIRTRRAAIKSEQEEYRRVLDVASRYAIHHAGVAVTCKKAGSGSADLHTQTDFSTVDCIRHVYGPSLARELIHLQFESTEPRFRAEGYVSNANHNLKKCTFILFINHRLVDCPTLRRTIEQIYKPYLPANTHPFVYLCLEMDGRSVDVNVHPTKSEVHFLHEERIITAVQEAIEAKLLGANHSRTYQTQAVLTGIEVRPRAGTADNARSNNDDSDGDGDGDDGDGDGDGDGVGARGRANTNANANDDDDDGDDDGVDAHSAPAVAPGTVSATQAAAIREVRRQQQKQEQRRGVLARDSAVGSGTRNDLGGGRALGLSFAPASSGPSSQQGVNSQGRPATGASSQKSGGSAGIVPAYKRDRMRGQQTGQMEAYLSQASQQLVQRRDSDEPNHDRGDANGDDDGDGDGDGGGDEDGGGTQGEGRGATARKRSAPAADASGDAGVGASASASASASSSSSSSSSAPAASMAARKRRKAVTTRLTSVRELLTDVKDRSHGGLAEVMQSHVYVGLADPSYMLVQHETKLLLVNVSALSRELMHQLALLQFGNLARIRLAEPLPIVKLAMAALDDPSSGWTPAEGPKDDLARAVATHLVSRRELLSEYFSIDIALEGNVGDGVDNGDGDGDGGDPTTAALTSLPLLAEGHTPDLGGLPMFVLRLATDVDWTEEKACFAGVASELAQFYMLPECDAGEEFRGPPAGSSAEQCAESLPPPPLPAAAGEWQPLDTLKRSHREHLVKNVLVPEMRVNLLPPEGMAMDGSFIQIAALEKLYSVFERC